MSAVTFVLKNVSPHGAASYQNPGCRGTVLLTKHMFGDKPPQTIVIDGEGIIDASLAKKMKRKKPVEVEEADATEESE